MSEREDADAATPLTTGARGSESCALCEAHASVAAAKGPERPRSDKLLPWLLAFAISGPFALLVDGAERWISLGLFAGLIVGAALVWHSRRASERHTVTALAATVERLASEADDRVNMVVKQFQWAVSDVVNLREELRRATAAKADLEARLQQSRLPVPLPEHQGQPRLDRELAEEEGRLRQRLMDELVAFEKQLAERLNDQEERLAQWWDEAERLAQQRFAAVGAQSQRPGNQNQEPCTRTRARE